MKMIDMHCDTISHFVAEGNTQGLKRNSLSVDLEKLKAGDSFLQCFAAYVDMKQMEEGYAAENAYRLANRMINVLHAEVEANADEIALIRDTHDILRNREEGLLSAMLTIEEGGILNGRIDRLSLLYKKGVRLITLTWNWENCIGFPNSKNRGVMSAGLKDFGFEVIAEMNRLHMAVDVSHLSDGGFFDVLKHSRSPVVASHSNARTVKYHPRNLTDEMLKILAGAGGVTGINFYDRFLGDAAVSRVSDMVRHISHIRNTAGIDVIALGSDFDGIECELEVNNSAQTVKLLDALSAAGFTTGELEKIWYQNAFRVLKDILG